MITTPENSGSVDTGRALSMVTGVITPENSDSFETGMAFSMVMGVSVGFGSW